MTRAQRRYIELPEQSKQTLAVLFGPDPRIGDTAVEVGTGVKYTVLLEPIGITLRIEVPAERTTTRAKKYTHTSLAGAEPESEAAGWTVDRVLATLERDWPEKGGPAGFDVRCMLTQLCARCKEHIKERDKELT